MIQKQIFSHEQKRAIAKLRENGRGICWWKLGEGKTRIALGWFADLQMQRLSSTSPFRNGQASILLFVTRPIAFNSVKSEILAISKDWHVVEFKKGKRQFSYAKPTVLLISHAGLCNHSELARMPIDCICFDEIHYFSNPKSKRSRAAKVLAERFAFRVCGLGGSLMPAQDNTTIWGQTNVIGLQQILARNITEYRKHYQRSSLIDFGSRSVTQFRNRDGSYSQIMEKLSSWVDFHMPTRGRKRVEQIIRCELTAEQKRYIRQLKREYYLKLEEADFELDMDSAMGIVCAVSRLANGYLYNTQKQVVDINSRKLEMLLSRIEDIVQVEQSKVVVWCHFRSDLEFLSRKIPFANLQMSGGKRFNQTAWQTGNYPVVLATEAIGSSFNDFAQVPYAIYFSMSYKWLDLDQSMGRTDRKSSTHSQCHYDFLLSQGTFDETIYETARKSGQDEQSLIRTGVKKWLLQNQ